MSMGLATQNQSIVTKRSAMPGISAEAWPALSVGIQRHSNVMILIFAVRELNDNVVRSISRHKGTSSGNSLSRLFPLGILTVRSPAKYNVRKFKILKTFSKVTEFNTLTELPWSRFSNFQRGMHGPWFGVRLGTDNKSFRWTRNTQRKHIVTSVFHVHVRGPFNADNYTYIYMDRAQRVNTKLKPS